MNEKAVAHHEAAHACLSIAFGLAKFEKVTIIPEEDWNGCVDYGEEEGKRIDGFWLFLCTTEVRLAGGIAKAKYLNTPFENVLQGASDDLIQIRDSLKRNNMSAEEAKPFIEWMMIRTRSLVDERWPMIQKIANELVKRKTLSYQEVELMMIYNGVYIPV